MKIPVFMTEITPDAADYVQANGATVTPVTPDAFYYLVTGKTTSGNGRSFLHLLGALLTASAGGVTWTAVLTADLKIRLSHNAGSPQNVTMNAGLAWRLGMAYNDGTASYGSASTLVGVLSTGTTFSYRPQWLWCPEMIISGTGPVPFDPALTSGCREAGGTSSLSPDMSGSSWKVGEQVYAHFMFRGVRPYYRAHPDTIEGPLDLPNLKANEDYVTWWSVGPSAGKRFIMWRDKTKVIGSAAPSLGTGAKPYTEYQPDGAMRRAPGVHLATNGNLVHWDITLTCWGTTKGEAVY